MSFLEVGARGGIHRKLVGGACGPARNSCAQLRSAQPPLDACVALHASAAASLCSARAQVRSVGTRWCRRHTGGRGESAASTNLALGDG